MRVFQFFLVALVTFGVTACTVENSIYAPGSPSGPTTPTSPTAVAVTGVTITPTSFNLSVGTGCTNSTQKLAVGVLPANATDTTFTVSVTNHGSVTVNSLSVTASKAGVDTITIVARGDTTKRASAVVTVSNVPCVVSITLSPNGGNGVKGSTAQATATVTGPVGTNTAITWYSTDPTKILVAQKDGDSITALGQIILANVKGGTLYFLSIGSAQICAQSVADATVRACATWTTK